MAARSVRWSHWFDRFQVLEHKGGTVLCRDRLRPGRRVLPRDGAAPGGGMPMTAEFFCRAFVPAVESAVPRPVADQPSGAADLMFWQFPCRTEAAAFELHSALDGARHEGRLVHSYVGLPWATWIDKRRVDPGLAAAHEQVRRVSVRLSGLREALEPLGVELRLHTVCQHVYWRDLLPVWRRLGITDAWLSHCPAPGSDAGAGIRLHPWRLFAVNVEDPARRVDLEPGRDPATKPLLASFIGAHAAHYICDTRLQLRQLADEPDIVVEITDRWHFEDVVYRHQVHDDPLGSTYQIDDPVRRYNRLLSDSLFSLCPAGAGANTLRLWESLAVGSVPVLLGPEPQLPREGELAGVDWDAIVLRWSRTPIAELPARLRQIPLEEVRRRQQLGRAVFRRAQAQRCF